MAMPIREIDAFAATCVKAGGDMGLETPAESGFGLIGVERRRQ
ncbi:hypothetical protein [Streptodolium elevatio]|uniref:Uncharacterized protein n=1 Tax=Streptodolium elevatio TaxID=3157996 RepID=A0ABV3DQ26_9ACTN